MFLGSFALGSSPTLTLESHSQGGTKTAHWTRKSLPRHSPPRVKVGKGNGDETDTEFPEFMLVMRNCHSKLY
eukprot:118560-Amphidinium_carterae.1